PEECVPVAVAVLRAFIDEGDRTDRTKARLKYVLERMGSDAFMAAVEKHLPFPLRRSAVDACRPRGPRLRDGHLGVHGQRQAGQSYIGVSGSAGRLRSHEMRAIAEIAERWGSGTLRLTVWQNLLISDVADADIPAVQAALAASGLASAPGSIGGSI